MLNVLVRLNSKYKQYVKIEIGRKVLYLQLLKVLYGSVQSALLWYKMFFEILQGMGLRLIHMTHVSQIRR